VKSKQSKILIAFLLVEAAIAIFYVHAQPNCEPCITGMPCPPCISQSQIVAICIAAFIAFAVLLYFIVDQIKSKKSSIS